MPYYFLDSNAIVKYYVTESGSTWLRALGETSQTPHIISEISLVEVASAIAQLQRDRRLGKALMRKIYQRLLENVQQGLFLSHPVSIQTIESAAQLAFKYSLKGYDAVQVAAVIAAQDILENQVCFLSGDKQALRAAGAEGLAIENPFDHVTQDGR